MKDPIFKKQPLRLASGPYAAIRHEILKRDGWHCQECGRSHNLQVHHNLFRSHGGEDSEDNLITLCADCHRAKHSH